MLTEREMLMDERRALEADLRPGGLDWAGVIERALLRRAARERIEEIDAELRTLRPARALRRNRAARV
jgi:50S ribosomal subunit-associated GTPase HflX